MRVVQRVDRCGLKLTGEVRYLCTDIGVSYHMGDNAFKWISFQSASRHTYARTHAAPHQSAARFFASTDASLLPCHRLHSARLLLSSPTMLQVKLRGHWNSSLNRAELEDHLKLASAKGKLEFQSLKADPARLFLHAVLEGKGLYATCSLRQPPNRPPVQTREEAAAFHVGFHDCLPGLPSSDVTLQSLDCAERTFSQVRQRLRPLWFHPPPALADAARDDDARSFLAQTLPMSPAAL